MQNPLKLVVSASVIACLLTATSCGNDVASKAAAQTTSPGGGSAAPAVPDRDTFVDPQGTYTITVGPDWVRLPGMVVQGVEAWSVAESADGFTTNVNLLTQDAPGRDLPEYMEFSAANMGPYELIANTMVVGAHGNTLGLLEYRSVPPEGSQDLPLHFLAAIDVRADVAIVATLSSLEAEFEEHRADVESFLLTLQAT